MEQRRAAWRTAGTVLVIGLLVASALQLHAVESRLVTQSQQLRVLGEATERMAAELERLRGGPSLGAGRVDSPSLDGVRHPELQNFLKPQDTHWPPPGATTNGVIAMDWPNGDPKGFNPLIENAAEVIGKLQRYVQSNLAQQNAWTNPDTYYEDLAWRVEVRDDFKELTFYLRKGVKWHPVSGVDLSSPRYAWLNAPHLLTAHDFVFMFDMLLHPQVQNGFVKSYYAELASYEALDDHTLRVKWKKTQALNVEFAFTVSPLPKFLYAYAEDGSPFPEATLGLNFNQHWYNNKGIVGTGPYRLASYTPGVELRLERYDDYFGELPAIKTIRYPIYSDRTQTVLKLKSGELSFGTLRAGQYREEVLRWKDTPEPERPKDSAFLNGEIKCDEVDAPRYSFIGWNANRPLFADRRVRRAMTLALNRQEIVTKVYAGMGRVARGPFLEATPYHAPDVVPLPFDLKEAAALLEAAGWVDTDKDGLLDRAGADGKRVPFEFTLLIGTSSTEIATAAKIFKEDLLGIGVKMSIESVEWSLMQKRTDEKSFDAYAGAWALPWSTDPHQLWHSSQADIPKGSNKVGFRNAKADALIDALRVTLDPDERTRLLRDVHRIIHEEQPYSFLSVPRDACCYRRGIEGVVYSKVSPDVFVLPWWSTQTDG